MDNNLYTQGSVKGKEYSAKYCNLANQYVFEMEDEVLYFDDTYRLDKFLDRLESFEWSCMR